MKLALKEFFLLLVFFLEIGRYFAQKMINLGNFPKSRQLQKTELLQDPKARKLLKKLDDCDNAECFQTLFEEFKKGDFELFDMPQLSSHFSKAAQRIDLNLESKMEKEKEETEALLGTTRDV